MGFTGTGYYMELGVLRDFACWAFIVMILFNDRFVFFAV
jgi:hypothetical protein